MRGLKLSGYGRGVVTDGTDSRAWLVHVRLRVRVKVRGSRRRRGFERERAVKVEREVERVKVERERWRGGLGEGRSEVRGDVTLLRWEKCRQRRGEEKKRAYRLKHYKRRSMTTQACQHCPCHR